MLRTAGVLILVSIALGAACRPPTTPARITIDVTQRHQTIEGWGTSMIFWDQAKTPYRTEAWRKAFRDLGLNILRINVNKEVLVDPSGDMSVPVVLGADLDENVARMRFDHPKTTVYGEMAAWLQQNALEPERVKITGSIWSPPHWMKGPTGKRQHHVTRPEVSRPTPWLSEGTHGDSIGGRLLQSSANLSQFGRYLAAWLVGFEKAFGVPLYAVSIQNELSFENPFGSATYFLGPKGEEAQWWQYATALDAVRDKLRQQGVRARLMGPHMSQVGNTPGDPWGLWHQMSYIRAVKAHPDHDLLDALFAYNCNGYLGTDEAAVKMWAAYARGADTVGGRWPKWLHAPGVASDGKPLWISEAGGAQNTWLHGTDGKPGDGAITVALKMHNALVLGEASAYVYWQLSDTEVEAGPHTLLGKKDIAEPTRSKKYSSFKHYARFIRPGATRVAATFDGDSSTYGGRSRFDTAGGLNVSAYHHTGDRMLTIVIVNMLDSGRTLEIRVPSELSVKTLTAHTTSTKASFQRGSDVTVSDGRAALHVPKFAVMTLHGETDGSP